MNEEEKQELETLRAEKLRREQVERARAALERGGVPQSFAPLLAGGDDGDTDRRTEEFRAAYQASLAEDVKTSLAYVVAFLVVGFVVEGAVVVVVVVVAS